MDVLVFDINYRFDYKQIDICQQKKEHFQLSCRIKPEIYSELTKRKVLIFSLQCAKFILLGVHIFLAAMSSSRVKQWRCHFVRLSVCNLIAKLRPSSSST